MKGLLMRTPVVDERQELVRIAVDLRQGFGESLGQTATYLGGAGLPNIQDQVLSLAVAIEKLARLLAER